MLSLYSLQDYQPLPPSDLPSTLSDISESRAVLGFDSQVSLQNGIKKFIKWFKAYKLLRARNEDEERNRPLE